MAGRPRANRAEDWSAQPPDGGYLGLEPVPAVVAAAAVAAAAHGGTLNVFAGSLARAFLFGHPGDDQAAVDWAVRPRPDPAVLPRGRLRWIQMQVLDDSGQ